LYCVLKLHTVISTLRWAVLTVLCVGFCARSFVCVLCVYFFILQCYVIVARWGGPGGIEAYYLGPYLPSVVLHCRLGHMTHKTRPRPQYDL